jgi:hypothetical protein
MPSPGTPIPAADVNLAQQRNVGPSTLGISDLTASVYTTEAALDSITVPVINGRKYRISYICHAAATAGITVGGSFGWQIRIKEGAVGGTQLSYATMSLGDVNQGIIKTVTVWAEWTSGISGNQTFTTTAFRSTGTGTMQAKGASGQPRILSVEWLGQYA